MTGFRIAGSWPGAVRPGAILLAAVLALLPGPVAGQEVADPARGEVADPARGEVADPARVTGPSGLPLPRFVSIRAKTANLRTGPGVRYPIEWVYIRRNMPVEIIAEFDTWRQIRDWNGTTGWMHRSLLSGTRTLMVRTHMLPLHRAADAAAPIVARAEKGAVGRLLGCEEAWCRVEMAGGYRGWSPRTAFWGLKAGETLPGS